MCFGEWFVCKSCKANKPYVLRQCFFAYLLLVVALPWNTHHHHRRNAFTPSWRIDEPTRAALAALWHRRNPSVSAPTVPSDPIKCNRSRPSYRHGWKTCGRSSRTSVKISQPPIPPLRPQNYRCPSLRYWVWMLTWDASMRVNVCDLNIFINRRQ